MIGERSFRKDMIAICRLMHRQGLTAASDGNVSALIGENRLLATPSGFNKGLLEEDDLVVTDRTGKLVHGLHQPSSEMAMHLVVYDTRPDVRAVIHAHPPTCVALSLVGMTLEDYVLPEAVLTIGRIPTAAYATPTTIELAASIERLVKNHDAMILDLHGSLTVGSDLTTAYNQLERMEYLAKVISAAHQIGSLRRLTPEQIHSLLIAGQRLKNIALHSFRGNR